MKIYDYQGHYEDINNDGPRLSIPWVSAMHRGYSSPTIHENTLEAFYRAYQNGADWIEVDARLSMDGIYVSNHDSTITVDGVTHTIANETAEALTSLVLSVDPIYGDCHIPTLESVLKMCAYTGMCANIDCKAINPSTLAKLVVDCGMSGRAAYANTTPANAAIILSVDPNAGFIFQYSYENLDSWDEALTDYHTRSRSFSWSYSISSEMIDAIKAKGFKYAFTPVTASNYQTVMAFAPDMCEFHANADCKAINEAYLQSLDFGL